MDGEQSEKSKSRQLLMLHVGHYQAKKAPGSCKVCRKTHPRTGSLAHAASLPAQSDEDVVVGVEEHRLTGHDDTVTCLAVKGEGTLLPSSSTDCTIKVHPGL